MMTLSARAREALVVWLVAAVLLGASSTGVVAQDATPAASALQPYVPAVDLAGLDGEIAVDGSSTVWPITDEAAVRFMDLAEDVEITVEFSGTGGGFRAFCAGETDIQNASRAIDAGEAAACAAAGIEHLVFEVGYDGVSVVVNPSNDFVSCLTVDQLKRLWQHDDPAETWQDLDPAWPDRQIELYGPGPDSGTYDYFVESIIGVADGTDLTRTDYFPSENDLDLVEGVEAHDDALGYFGYAYYEAERDALKLVAVDAGGGCVLPSPATIAGGSYRPLSRPLYVYVSTTSLARPEVREFLRYYLANAPELTTDAGYVTSPDAVYIENQRRLESAVGN